MLHLRSLVIRLRTVVKSRAACRFPFVRLSFALTLALFFKYSMDTGPPDTSFPQADSKELPNVLFDDPNADVVLHSNDGHSFRVLKLYIIRCSTILGELIQAASDSFGAANPASADSEKQFPRNKSRPKKKEKKKQLPEVQLSDRGAILSCLLTFIFPVPSVLPSSLEEEMELLSVAQKYEVDTVIDQIRGALALQNPPCIHKDNAFLAYSLAQRYGLRREAIQAARLTLQFTLTIEKFQDVVPGAYLHELWKYHQRFQAQLKSGSPLSRAAGVLNAFKCSQSNTSPPGWIHSFIGSIMRDPTLFDPIEFQLALMRHTMATVLVDRLGNPRAGCIICTQISAEEFRTFWTTLADMFHRGMEKVGIYYVNTSVYLNTSAVRVGAADLRDGNEPGGYYGHTR